jgi:hypothetical protein
MFEKLMSRFRKVEAKPVEAEVRDKEQLKSQFFKDQNHQWIADDRWVKAHFESLFDLLPEWAVTTWHNTGTIHFMKSSGRYSSALHNNRQHTILVYPELFKLLQSPAIESSLAIIAHELGHILLNHAERKIDALEAQIEADDFAAQLGLHNQIESLLLAEPESMEKRVRLSYLTTTYFSNIKEEEFDN